MNVLSLFDGIAGAYQALKNININVNKYYSSEIDRYASIIAIKNHTDLIPLGDINTIDTNRLPQIELLIGGSPCQDLSISKKNRQGLEGEKSKLFYKYLEIKNKLKPKYFILENVASMSQESKDLISDLIGVYPVMINSALLTAQQRKRLYWTNIDVLQPFDKHIYLKDVLEHGYTDRLKAFCVDASYYKGTNLKDYFTKHKRQIIFNKPVKIGIIRSGGQGQRVYSVKGKSVCLSANGGGSGAKTGLYNIKNDIRKLTPIECERLQGYPDDYTKDISNTQRYKCLGNSFTVPVIEHVLSCGLIEGYREQFMIQQELF